MSQSGAASITRFPWTGNQDADQLLEDDPLALLIGMLLDQQFPMERAFLGPYRLAERLGVTRLSAEKLVSHDPEKLARIFQGPPAIHRYPAAMAARTQALAEVIAEQYQGETKRLWQTSEDGQQLRQRLQALPGFGEAKTRIFIGVIGQRLQEGPPGWEKEAADWPSIADVARWEDIAALRNQKREMKQQTRSSRQPKQG